jgi:glutamate:GABA antiporter
VTVFAVAGLTVAVTMNVVGLDIGKWLTNVGAVCGWIPLALLVAFGLHSWLTRGSATSFTPATLAPGTSLKDLVFFSSIAFAFAGVESASTMGEEIVDAPRTVPRAVITASVLIALFYIVGTWCLLLALPKEQLSGLEGVMQATQVMAGRAGAAWVVPIVAVLLTVSVIGGLGGWFASCARLPFVAGIDRYLPAAFARLHPRWRTPYVSLLVQAAFAFAFVFIGEAGTTVRGAYDALVSMAVITNFIPFLYMFAAMAKLTDRKLLASVGFLMTVAAIVLACVPPEDDPNKALAVIKIVGVSAALVAAGAFIYYLGKRRL